MSVIINGQRMRHRAVNTDPLQIISTPEYKQTHYGLKIRNIPHIKVAAANELKVWYEFGHKIGEGGFGTVITVTEKSTNRKWAMKTVTKSTTDRRLQMVHQEIQILKLIRHPHIIYLDKVFESNREIYMIFEKCNGDFSKLYNERKPFGEVIAKKIITDLVDAVAYLHKYDIVHRDLKMENILLGDNPSDPSDEYYIKLTDFGLSIVQSGKGIESMLHEFCGTLHYMAPEMITLRSYTQTCDMWSIGVILYMLVVGKFPFFSKNEKELQEQICSREPTLKQSNLSDEVCNLITLLLIKDPVKRIRATEVLQHPWIQNKKLSQTMNYNIMEKMKEWKSEMTVVAGAVSDWVAAPADLNTPKNNNKQPLNMHKTNINFDRNTKSKINKIKAERSKEHLAKEASKHSNLKATTKNRKSNGTVGSQK